MNRSKASVQDLSSASSVDLERNGRLRYESEMLADNGPAKQMQQQQQHKSSSQQANWQAARPTIIQIPKDSRAARRQADFYHTVDDSSVQPEELGIQMRVSMSRSKDATRRPQQLMDEPQFEQQQQNQMIDYGEDSESDLADSQEGNAPANTSPDQERLNKPNVDSSSSNMMMPSEGSARVKPNNQEDSSTRNPPPPLMMLTTKTVDKAPKTSSEPGGATDRAPTDVQPASQPSESPSASLQPSTTSTSAPSTSVAGIDLSETPISIEPAGLRTTPEGRVELMNGRPAPGMRQQMPSTNSVRLPTSTMPSSIASDSDQPASGTQADRSSSTVNSNSTSEIVPKATATPGAAKSSTERTQVAGGSSSTTSLPSTFQSTSAAPGETTTGEPAGETTESADESEEDDEQTDKPSLNSATNEGSAANEDDDEAEEEADQTSTSPTSGELSSTAKEPATTTTTTTPSANIEIERLPKVDQPEPQNGRSSPSQKPSANLVMTNLADQQTGLTNDPSAGISMPMDVLMRMIMINQMVEEDRRKATSTSTVSPMGTTPDGKLESSSTPTESKAEGQETRLRPQPPPTTRMPSSLSTPSTPRFMTIRVESSDVSSPAGDEAEPKVELLNLDLMPIQRIMTAQDRQSSRTSTQSPQSQQPAQPKQTDSPKQSIGEATDTSRPSTSPVEPGMRLRPVITPSQNVATRQPAGIGTMMNVKVIGKQPTVAHTKKPTGDDTSTSSRVTVVGSSTTVSSTTTMVASTASPSASTSTSRAPSSSGTSSTTFAPASSTTSPTSSISRLSDASSSTQSSTPEVSPTTGSSVPSSSASSSNVPTQASSSTSPSLNLQSSSTTTRPLLSKAEQAEVTSTTRPRTTSSIPSDTSRAQVTNTTTATSVSVSGSPEPSSTSGRPSQAPMLERIQQQTTTRPGATKISWSKINSSKQGNATLSGTFIPTKLRSDFSKTSPAARANQTALVKAPPTNRFSTAGSTDQELITTSSPSPLQAGMAIRQFGGANRMSVLSNQPVPFGRPSAMQAKAQRYELPSFEYGPAIAVRRPDEPLANGQMPNCTLTGKNFCVLTKDYPMNEVRQAVERSFRSVRIMYEELQTVSDQELHKEDFLNATSSQAASGKFACQTQVEMMRPGWAKDEITKEWMLVVNTDVFPQRVRTESCAQPNTPCEFIAPFYDSTCQQRYSLHRMIAIDPHDPSRSPQVAVFKFPAGCVCRVHPIRKTTSMMIQTTLPAQQTTPIPATIISSSTSRSIRRRRR